MARCLHNYNIVAIRGKYAYHECKSCGKRIVTDDESNDSVNNFFDQAWLLKLRNDVRFIE